MGRRSGGDGLNGFVSGVLATAAMSGLSSAITRVKQPLGPSTPRGPKHYEMVGVRLVQMLAGDQAELNESARIRLGEALHSVFGGIMGVGFIKGTERLPIPAALRGTVHGVGLWLGAFAGYFPLLGISEGVWAWDGEDARRSFRSHLTYGNAVMLMTRGWRSGRGLAG